MKKIMSFVWLVVLLPTMLSAQEKIEAPVWNVGDKWVFTQGNIEVVGADQNSYTLNFSKDTCVIENKRLEKMVFDKSSLNKIYILKEEKREKFTMGHRRILNFPLTLGMEWKDTFSTASLAGPGKGQIRDYVETFKVLGWENVLVPAGNFKALKLEYYQESSSGRSGKAFYWYAPEAKYFVKCQYDTVYWTGVADWELVSRNLEK
jgi:hypothetical protein